jgi:hypothetical protein
MDINTLPATADRERSFDEYDALLARAGLRCAAVVTTKSPQSVIEAIATVEMRYPGATHCSPTDFGP